MRLAAACLAALALATPPALAQQAPAAAPPQFATTKVTDNVYVFRMMGHQAMFVVTPEGVIATDPVGFVNKKGGEIFLAEIRKITQAPVKYVVYSHHHYDHIAGGKPFKDAGATFVAHRNAQKQLAALKNPEIVLPDQVVDERSTIELGGTRLDLVYVGRNHSDNTLVIHLPKEKIIFTVDWIPIQAVQFRDLPDGFLPDWFEGFDRVLAMDWERMIPGHPGPGGRLGTKDDVRAAKQYMTDVSDAAKQLAAEGKCLNDEAMNAVKLPKYEGWGAYAMFLPRNVERFCEYWGRGY
ncbi:MAG: MBL fold metallo-hydrolase [Betaproteobacteria bacterium]|jgi:glyoxylase-like metal-dependent hydrolase (beta-lactamase superfamily II)|nr:MBL fold metallo-hydrolase [Betaproteobacteria bacterium]